MIFAKKKDRIPVDYACRSGASYALSRWAGRCRNGRGGRLGDLAFAAARWGIADVEAFAAGAQKQWKELKTK